MEYLDFDVRVQTGSNGQYKLHAESENHGEVDAVITLHTDAPEVKDLLQCLATRKTDRTFLETFGRDLYRRLFVDGIETIFQRSYGEVEGDNDRGLRLRLRFASPELAILPWELLFSPADNKFIGTRVSSPLVRYLELPRYKRELATPFPLRILVAIPQGSDPALALDSDSEKAVIEQALEGLSDKVEVTYLQILYETEFHRAPANVDTPRSGWSFPLYRDCRRETNHQSLVLPALDCHRGLRPPQVQVRETRQCQHRRG